MPGSGVPLLERDAELGVLADALAAARAGLGGAVLVRGPAGIGKTRLVGWALDRARAEGMRGLSVRAAELERDFAFGVMRGLLEPALAAADRAERAALFEGAAGLARPVLDPAVDASDAAATLLHGLYWLVANLAERHPVLLAVDDAHWADRPSLRALAYLLRRIEGLPVLVLLAARPTEPHAERAMLEALAEEPATRVVEPGPLSRAAVQALISTVLDERPDDEFGAVCHEVTGGNPLLLGALLRGLRSAGVAPRTDAVEEVTARAPTIVSSFVLPRLRRLPSDAVALARALAVLGPGTQLRHGAAVAGLDVPSAAAAADQLRDAELLVPVRPLEFVHPLIGEAIAEHMPVAERTAGHATAARELAADNADPEAVAAHLLVAEPCRDAWVVDRLVTAARAAAAKGAPRSVITYLTRALAEPPQPQHRAAVLAELGAAQVQAGMSDGFATLQQALQLTADPLRRARIGHTAAAALSALGDFRRTEPLLRQALHDAAGADPELALSIEAMLVALLRTRVDTAAEATQRLHRLRTAATADTAAGCLLLGTLAIEIAQVPGRGGEAAELATRAVAAAHRPDAAAGTLFPVIYVVIATGAHDRGQLACDAAIAAARRRHAIPDLGSLLCARSLVGLARGAVAAAEADARASLDIATELEIAAPRRYVLAGLLGAMVEQGRFEDADRELRDAALPLDLVFLVHAVGRLRAAQGRTAEALAHFLDCGARLERRRWRHPGLVSWQADAALAAHRLDRTAEARRLADDAVHAAERYAAPTALGVALRAAGMIDARLDLLHAAVEALAPTPARLEHARALVELGAALRRANQRVSAREPLRLGGDTAHHCGAMSLAGRAEDELRAAGARPRRRAVHGVDALTTCERRVADLAATGSSNREIAQALFVTVKTVELHLGAAYRKLGISSRAELPDALATDRR